MTKTINICLIDDHQLVIFSDYLKGTLHDVSRLIALANERDKKVTDK